MEPSRDEWQELYAAAVAFRDAAPWQWMWDGDVFGVQDPQSGEIGYCCVMGRGGEHYALGVYLGSEGLEILWNMRREANKEIEDPAEILATQLCLMASFEDRNQLRQRDLELIKTLGLKFRGRNQWLLFRSYRPGYEPWYLTAEEARFLTACLQQSLDVAPRFRANPKLFPPPSPHGNYLVRVPEPRDEEWAWQDTLQFAAPVSRTAPVLPPLDEALLSRLRALPATRGALEIDYFYSGSAIQEDKAARPYLGQVVLVVEAASGMVVGMKVASLEDAPATAARQLLDTIEQSGTRPGSIEAQRDDLLAALKPLADGLGIRLVHARRLRAVARFRREMQGFRRLGWR
jgi:Domain of unknown function (DUF6930)